MTRILLFFVLLAMTMGYAIWRGDRDSRLVAAICIVAVILTQIVARPVVHRFASIESGVVLVDVATLGGFIAIALASSRFWPLWVAGFQLTTLLGHLLKAIDWSLFPRAYGTAMVFWSYPILIVVVVGAWRAHRRRLAEPPSDGALA